MQVNKSIVYFSNVNSDKLLSSVLSIQINIFFCLKINIENLKISKHLNLNSAFSKKKFVQLELESS